MFSYNRATLDELHPSFFSEKWLSVLARSTFLVETTFLRIITGCVCVNCEGLGIKFKSYASSCLIFNAYIPRVACSYHKEMTSHEWNWVLLVELKNLIYWISNCRKTFLLKKCVFEHRYPILLDRFSWFCFAFEIPCCAIFCKDTKQLWKGYLVAASESMKEMKGISLGFLPLSFCC